MENPVVDSTRPSNPFARLGDFLRRHWRDYAFLFPFAGIIVGLDQWTKALVRASIPLGGDWLPEWLAWLAPYARIRHWHNTGAAFGLFQNGALVFAVLAIIVSALIIYYFPHTPRAEWWLRLALGMQLGGALGNLVDRLAFEGRVTDFISVGDFAIFNLADSSITVGVGVLLLGVWLKERAEKRQAAAAAAGENGG